MRALWVVCWVGLVVAGGCADGSSPPRGDSGGLHEADASGPPKDAEVSRPDAELAIDVGAPDSTAEPDAEASSDAEVPDASDGGDSGDASAIVGPDAALVCPRTRPDEQSACREAEDGMQCYYLEQCCCGRCYPQDVCVCVSSGGGYVWSCGFLDVCPAVCEPPSDAGVTD
ncbi:hypothetical protein L6R52_18050 [Myxococcota bacterium]|nr:hypothetical protein [Myxococcota bacterium]